MTLRGIGAIVGIFLILGTAFGSYKDALIIMLNLPLASVGGVVGAYLAGGVLSVASIVGFITLFGMATRNGIIDDLPHSTPSSTRRNGSSRRRHARCGREARSHTDDRVSCGLALVPIVLGMGKPGSEIQAPMAIVIFFGLLSSTALNMVVVPTAYYCFGKGE